MNDHDEFDDLDDFDPTGIELLAESGNPLDARMTGVTVHKAMPFDCPVITAITDDLWMGGYDDGLVLPDEVDHVISLYRWAKYDVAKALQSYLVVEMYDDDTADVPAEQVEMLARWINVCRKSGTTLVHCQAGLNRSALVVATALTLDGHSPADAIELLRTQRSRAVLCNQAFEDWLLDFAPEPIGDT